VLAPGVELHVQDDVAAIQADLVRRVLDVTGAQDESIDLIGEGAYHDEQYDHDA
jgi:hypothetical protein